MIRCSRRALLMLVALHAAGICAAAAQDLSGLGNGDDPTTVDADQVTYDRLADVVSASGNVVIRRGELELHADEVRVNRGTNEAQARGEVRVLHPEGEIVAEAVDIDLDDEVGFLRRAKLQSSTHRYSLAGDLIEKKEGQEYRISQGCFTTCQCGERRPDWSLSGDELDVTIGGYAHLKGARFNILDVPVLYVPRAIFPVRQERQSGFLRPRFGASNRRGLQAVVPFYWAINKSHDATLAFDVETSARLGALGEYRYQLSRRTGGILRGSYFNELLRGDAEGLSLSSRLPENRWSFGWDHSQPLLAGVEGYVDGFVVSDDAFLREINTFAFEYNRDVALRTLPFTESRIGAIRTWDRAAVKLEGVYYQDLDLTGIVDLAGQGTPTGVRESRRDSLTLQRAPEIAAMGQSLIGSYLMGDFSASAVNYQRGGLDSLDLERGQGIDGLRLDLHPGLTVPLPLGKYAFGSVRGSVRETAYHLIQRDDVDGRRYDRSDSREMFQLQAQVGTALSRIYPLRQFGIDKVKHTIEPIAEYLYVPSIDQSELAFFDRIDRINRRNLATAGVTTRLIGKASPEEGEAPPLAGEGMRELGRLWLMQSVDFDRRIAQIDDFEDRGAADHFSDIDFGGHINPSRSLSLRFQSHVDTGDGELSGTTVGFFVQDWREQPQDRRLLTRTSAGVSYRFLTQDILQEINANAVIGVTRWLGLFYAARYDLLETRFLDNHFGLRLVSTCDCWALDIGVTDRSNPNELEARVQLTLVGLGSSEERVAEAP